ncbi:MAG: CoA:oxalate CoA-transferase [Oceanicoccus sp.]|jgi:CoA:oxalate CoA-transferase
MSKLLDGIKIVDLTHVLAGPYCTYQLGLLGADITRIENPAAVDLPRILDADPDRLAQGMGAGFIAANANKRSVAIDLSSKKGQDLARQLIANADVVIENFRPGVLKKYGLDAKTLTKENPRLIYCSISGFGQDSSYKDRPAYDDIIQAMSGLMAITGTTESGPVMAGFPVIDYLTGLMAAFAISAAVAKQARTGEGEVLDVAMLDSAMSVMGPVFALHHIAEAPIALRGNRSFSGSPFSGTYITAQGTIVVTANTPAQAKRFLSALQLDGLWENPKVRNWREYPEVAELIAGSLKAAFAAKSADEWEVLLNQENVPAGKLRGMPEMLTSPYSKERGFVHKVDIPALGREYPVPGVGFLAGGKNGHVESPPPVLGEHTFEVLRETGLSDREITELHDAGVVSVYDNSKHSTNK